MSAVGNYEVVSGSITVARFTTTSLPAPAGKVVFSLKPTNAPFSDLVSYPSLDGTSWVFDNTSGSFNLSLDYRMVVAEMGICPTP